MEMDLTRLLKNKENDLFQFQIYRLLRYHNRYLENTEKLESLKKEYNFVLSKMCKDDRLSAIEEILKETILYVHTFFSGVIINIANMIEGDKSLEKLLNEKISMDGFSYHRVYHKKVERNSENSYIDTVSKQIKHYRDSIVHSKSKNIYKHPEFVENNIEGGYNPLLYIKEPNYNEQCFRVGEGILLFSKLEKIIEICLIYNRK